MVKKVVQGEINVNLEHKKLSDISPLKNLTQLKELILSYTQVSDLTPLKNLAQLKELNISNTQVADLTPLKNLNQLAKLFLIKTKLTQGQVDDLQKALPNCDIRLIP